jgi:hypothetical protein
MKALINVEMAVPEFFNLIVMVQFPLAFVHTADWISTFSNFVYWLAIPPIQYADWISTFSNFVYWLAIPPIQYATAIATVMDTPTRITVAMTGETAFRFMRVGLPHIGYLSWSVILFLLF